MDPSDDRGWGTLVCGAVRLRPGAANPLLASLPAVVHLSGADGGLADLSTTLAQIDRANAANGPGSQVLLARLGDVLLLHVLRAWLAEQEPEPRGWLGALRDPQIGAAIAAVHASPHTGWTVSRLAHVAALSRSRFAQRFTAMVGEPPIAYVHRWRMTLAAELVLAGERTISDIARAVGYQSDPAFTRAFTRHFGAAPRRYGRSRPDADPGQPAPVPDRPL